jgi:hypothetical protein
MKCALIWKCCFSLFMKHVTSTDVKCVKLMQAKCLNCIRFICQVACFMLVSCLSSSALTMKVTCSSKTSFDFQQTTWHYVVEDRTLHNHLYENLKSYNTSVFLQGKDLFMHELHKMVQAF